MEGDYLNIDWTAALAEMEAKRDALNAAIEGLRAAMQAGSLPGGAPPPGSPGAAVPKTSSARPVSMGRPMPLPRGALLGKAAPEAIKVYLDAEKEKRTNRQIADALKQGGVESTSSNFDAFINSALFRLKKEGAILRFDDGWGLAEWYPESFRTRVGEKAGNGGKRKTKKAARKAKKAAPEAKASAPPKAKPIGLEHQILAVFVGDVELDAETIAFGSS